MPSSSEQNFQAPILGIDLGTTHSLVAVVRRNSEGGGGEAEAEVLPLSSLNPEPSPETSDEQSHDRAVGAPFSRYLLPSVIHIDQESVELGASAKWKRVTDAERTISSAKRLLGKSLEEVREQLAHLPYPVVEREGALRVVIGDRDYSVIELSAMILKRLKAAAEAELGVACSKAVITVPAYFNDSQRQATRTAGKLAGLDVVRMVNEPTAAALAYGFDRKKSGIVAVFDLGGGTFDLSLLKLHHGVFEVLSTRGDTALGGDDLDRAVLDAVLREVPADFVGTEDFQSPQWKAQALVQAERTKIALSEKNEALFELQWKGKVWSRIVKQSEFSAWVEPVLERTRALCEHAIADAGLTLDQIDDVLLVGGPTRLTAVREKVRSIFGKSPNTSLHPDQVVALGAAIQADILSGRNTDLLLLDVVPLSLGLETYGGLTSVLIPRNSKIPAVTQETFTTFVDHQTGVDLHVVQGEREKADENRSLARFKLAGIQPQPAGLPRIQVTFLVDADGVLQVSAQDQKTGKFTTVEVRPSLGLSDAEVQKLLEASEANRKEDLHFRKWTEAKNEAIPVLRATERSMEIARKSLTAAEVEKIENSMSDLRRALEGKDPEQIQAATLKLTQVTGKLADLLVHESLKSAQLSEPSEAHRKA